MIPDRCQSVYKLSGFISICLLKHTPGSLGSMALAEEIDVILMPYNYRYKTVCPNCLTQFQRLNNYNLFCSYKCRYNFYLRECHVDGKLVCAYCKAYIKDIHKRTRLDTRDKRFCSRECFYKFLYTKHAQSELYFFGNIKYIKKDSRFKKYANIDIKPLPFSASMHDIDR